MSSIIDDNIENAFLQDFMKMVEEKPDDEKIDKSITTELQDYVATKFNQTTIKK